MCLREYLCKLDPHCNKYKKQLKIEEKGRDGSKKSYQTRVVVMKN